MKDNDLGDSGQNDRSALASVGLFNNIKQRHKRAFLVAFAETGHVGKAARAAGIDPSLKYSAGWKSDHDFQTALRLAKEISVDGLEDVARARAVEGVKSYRFSKSGEPLRHPDMCDCGHGRLGHVLTPLLPGEDSDETYRGPCSHPDCRDCSRFVGMPYFEHVYSDTLLKFLLTGLRPETYSQKVELRGALATLDMSKLSDDLLARIAAGEHPLQVLASAAEDGSINPAQVLGIERQLPAPQADQGADTPKVEADIDPDL